MTKQIVDTEIISSSANKLRTADSNINSAFTTMQAKARQLDSNWKSRAGDAAISTMHSIAKNNDARSAVLQNYVNMLLQQVDPGYVSAENANVSLADKFK